MRPFIGSKRLMPLLLAALSLMVFHCGPSTPACVANPHMAGDPCCPTLGATACPSGLFCAALDGATEPTCHFEMSQAEGRECTEDRQCALMSCNTTVHRCRYAGVGCDPCVGCIAGSYCDTNSSSMPVCSPGDVDTEHSPGCAPPPDGGAADAAQIPPAATPNLDLLIAIDNSSSMVGNQSALVGKLDRLFAAVPGLDIHVGVISSDLGTPGANVPGCVNSDAGDDGLLNPIRNGAALQQHQPTTCADPSEFPAFLSFASDAADQRAVSCTTELGRYGCGLEQQLESVYRALVEHDASDAAGNADPNAGFLRSDAILAILALTDEEDGSVRNCDHANGNSCTSALDVYNASSGAWASSDLNLRFYLYQPGSQLDPTWPPDRYIRPADARVGLLGLKPGHPERVLFAAITGVPVGVGTRFPTDWNQLLGTPLGSGPDDYYHRGTGSLTPSPDGQCTNRVTPICRREGASPQPGACTEDIEYFAWPARRIAEIARRFDEGTHCAGSPCRNGFVSSICAADFGPALDAFGARIAQRAAGQ